MSYSCKSGWAHDGPPHVGRKACLAFVRPNPPCAESRKPRTSQSVVSLRLSAQLQAITSPSCQFGIAWASRRLMVSWATKTTKKKAGQEGDGWNLKSGTPEFGLRLTRASRSQGLRKESEIKKIRGPDKKSTKHNKALAIRTPAKRTPRFIETAMHGTASAAAFGMAS